MTPGESAGTRKTSTVGFASGASCTLAKVMNSCASGELVMKRFSPVIRQPSPSGTALVRMLAGLEPAPDSVRANEATTSPLAIRLIILMGHVAKDGSPKILPQVTLPVTGRGVVDRIITDLAVLDVTSHGLLLVEHAPGVSVEEIQAATGVPLTVSDELVPMAATPA